MSFLIRRFPTMVTLLVLCSPSAADNKKPSPPKTKPSQADSKRDQEIEEIVITSPLFRGKQLFFSQEELLRERISKTVEGMFANVAGIDLKRRSVAGNESKRVNLRGFDESRLQVQLDGRSLHGAGVQGGYFVDWASLTLENIESIQLIKGVAPVKYGNTLGGVIDIRTLRGSTERPQILIRATGGSLSSWHALLSHSWGFGPMRYQLAASHYETAGYLRNATLERNSVSGKLIFVLPAEIELTAAARYNVNDCGMVVYNQPDSPYYDAHQPASLESALGGPNVPFLNHGPNKWGALDWGDQSHWKDHRVNVDLALSKKMESFSVKLLAYLIEQYRTDYFYAVENPRLLVLKRSQRPEKHNWGWRLDLKNTLEMAGTHSVEYGAEGTYRGYGKTVIKHLDKAYFPEQKIPQDSASATNVTMLHGFYLQDRWQMSDYLAFQGGVRIDRFDANHPAENTIVLEQLTASPALIVMAHLWPGGRLGARYRRAFRFPTIPEYYWWNNGFKPQQRRDLTEEKAHQWEIEAEQQWPKKAAICLRGYYYRVDNYLRTIFGYRPSRVIYNIERVDLAGFEVEGSYQFPYHLNASFNYTFQFSEKHGDILDNSAERASGLSELPQSKANATLTWQQPQGLQARLSLRYVHSRKAVYGDLTQKETYRLITLDPYVNLSLYANYPILQNQQGGKVQVEATIENLLNQHYEEEYGYPLPGFLFMAGLRAML